MALRFGWLMCATVYLVLQVVYAIDDDFQLRCLSFMPGKHVRNSTRTVLEYVPANTTLNFLGNDATCARLTQFVSVDLCQIALSIPTSERSSITFELWLPRNWYGRFLQTGNGGIDGCGGA
jgi:feruloyl esterase